MCVGGGGGGVHRPRARAALAWTPHPPAHRHERANPTLLGAQVFLREVALLADYKLDESYTPARVSVRARRHSCMHAPTARPPLPLTPPPTLAFAQVRVGNSFSDLREVAAIDLHEPQVRHGALHGAHTCVTRGFGARRDVATGPTLVPPPTHPAPSPLAAPPAPQGWVVIPLAPEGGAE